MLRQQTRKYAVATIAGVPIFPIVLLLSSVLGSSVAFTPTPTLQCHSPLATNHLGQGSSKNSNSNSNSNSNINSNNLPRISLRLSAQTSPQQSDAETLKAEAEALRAEAQKLRSEIEEASPQENGQNNDGTNASVANANAVDTTAPTPSPPASPWTVPVAETTPSEEGARDYRLYVDIGREEGTWMDPRWGASGKRIEFALDIKLCPNRPATPEAASKMVKDNSTGKSSPVFALETAPFARLRDGFDRMKCGGGAYRIDTGKNGSNTLRMYVEVEGTTRADSGVIYGDISVPAGRLYFSLPCFGSGIDNLSIKEGVVSVRQIGWHTGWRREESRICGVFTAKPVIEARKRDRY